MGRSALGALAASLLLYSPVRADRLDAVWTGPNGNGSAGDWNVAANWNLGVVPNNRADGNVDGLPDIYDVQIDHFPAATAVHIDSSTIEFAGLNLGEDDVLELAVPHALTLRDPDGIVEVVNHGSLRVGGANNPLPRLAFAGEQINLAGDGGWK